MEEWWYDAYNENRDPLPRQIAANQETDIQCSQRRHSTFLLNFIVCAAFVLPLSSDTVISESEIDKISLLFKRSFQLMLYSLFDNSRVSWCDKNFNAIALKNGQIYYNEDISSI